MKLSRDIAGACLLPGGSVVAIGAFDGLHRGHQRLLAEARMRAAARGCAPVVVSFEPLPRAYFSRQPLPRLSSVREKLAGFADAGIAHTLLLRFNAALTQVTAEDFVRRVLVARLAAREIWVGGDFRFGHGRAGDVDLLEQMGRECGFTTRVMPPVLIDGERVSASRVRSLLAASDFVAAKSFLGRAFTISGRVEHGNELGRTLGFPTANVSLHRRVSPLAGVYAVRAGLNGERCTRPGVASLGTRPTVNEVPHPLLETCLFDFDGDLYGQRMTVEFIAKLRDEHKFADLDALKTQMDHDARSARTILGVNPALARA